MCEATVSRLHHDLKIIGNLREGDRVRCVDGFLAISRPTLFEALVRWTRGENRQQSVACVAHTLFDALSLVEQAVARGGDLDHASRSMVRRFVLELHQALHGLRCLWVTYGDDPSIQARIMVLRESTMDRVANLEQGDLASCGLGLDRQVANGARAQAWKSSHLGGDEEQGFALVHTALALSSQKC